jgi:predicted RNA-binding Zn ribbon-like protein
MAKYAQSLAKQELTQRFTKGQNKMYEVTSNQKEQLLNQMLNALTKTTAQTAEGDRQFLLSMYEKVQRLRLGQSLSVTDAMKLKSLIKKATSSDYRPCPNKGGAFAFRGCGLPHPRATPINCTDNLKS